MTANDRAPARRRGPNTPEGKEAVSANALRHGLRARKHVVLHFEDPEAYLKISPSTYATDITTPLLILHSENDWRCPVGHAEDLFTILRLRKQDVEMVRFPEEGHELSRSGSPVHRVQRFEVILDWFDRKLRGSGGQPAEAEEAR